MAKFEIRSLKSEGFGAPGANRIAALRLIRFEFRISNFEFFP
jgi:hypothetical protein